MYRASDIGGGCADQVRLAPFQLVGPKRRLNVAACFFTVVALEFCSEKLEPYWARQYMP
jgi:hypothetical protein